MATATAILSPKASTMETPSLRSHERPSLPRIMTNMSWETRSAIPTPVPLTVDHEPLSQQLSPSVSPNSQHEFPVFKEPHGHSPDSSYLSPPQNIKLSRNPHLSLPETPATLEQDSLSSQLTERLNEIARQQTENLKDQARQEAIEDLLRSPKEDEWSPITSTVSVSSCASQGNSPSLFKVSATPLSIPEPPPSPQMPGSPKKGVTFSQEAIRRDNQRRSNVDSTSSSRSEGEEPSAVVKAWQTLFVNGKPTARCGEILRAIGSCLIQQYSGTIALSPEDMNDMYKEYGPSRASTCFQNRFRYEKHFRASLANLYRDLECEYIFLAPNSSSIPVIPALTPKGFERWMLINILASPDVEAQRMSNMVQKLAIDVADPDTPRKMQRLPKKFPRRLFPAEADAESHGLLGAAIRKFYEPFDWAPPPSPYRSEGEFSPQQVESRPVSSQYTSSQSRDLEHNRSPRLDLSKVSLPKKYQNPEQLNTRPSRRENSSRYQEKTESRNESSRSARNDNKRYKSSRSTNSDVPPPPTNRQTSYHRTSKHQHKTSAVRQREPSPPPLSRRRNSSPGHRPPSSPSRRRNSSPVAAVAPNSSRRRSYEVSYPRLYQTPQPPPAVRNPFLQVPPSEEVLFFPHDSPGSSAKATVGKRSPEARDRDSQRREVIYRRPSQQHHIGNDERSLSAYQPPREPLSPRGGNVTIVPDPRSSYGNGERRLSYVIPDDENPTWGHVLPPSPAREYAERRPRR